MTTRYDADQPYWDLIDAAAVVADRLPADDNIRIMCECLAQTVTYGLEARDARFEDDEVAKLEALWRLERAYWKDALSVVQRGHEALEILSDARLTVGELTARLSEKHPDMEVYDATVRSVVNRLYTMREIDREPETFRSQVRYRYFKRALEGPIVELDRVFHENGEQT